jgi:superfamily I DNA and/or RNA helicase
VKAFRTGHIKSLPDDLSWYHLGHPKGRDAQRNFRLANVICTTAMSNFDGVLENAEFQRILFDEAAQATETNTLVPICKGSSQVVLVGDECQLPPTVSEAAAELEFDVSLFERLSRQAVPITLLNIQYRMPSAIFEFSRRRIYNNAVTDADEVRRKSVPTQFPWPVASVPLCVLTVPGEENKNANKKLQNQAEAQVVISVTALLLRKGVDPKDIAILVPYAGQVELLQSLLKKEVEVCSVDQYQGKESRFIIFNTVRSNEDKNVGFLTEKRRLNVALTRAKEGLICVVNPETLANDKGTMGVWLKWAQEKKVVVPASKYFFKAIKNE